MRPRRAALKAVRSRDVDSACGHAQQYRTPPAVPLQDLVSSRICLTKVASLRAKPLPARECQTSPRRRVGGGAARSCRRTPALLVAQLLPPTHTVRLHVREQPRTPTRLPRQLEHLRATLLRAGRMGCALAQQRSARGMPHRARTRDQQTPNRPAAHTFEPLLTRSLAVVSS